MIISTEELREEVKWYLSFTNEEVSRGWPSPRRKRRRVQRPFWPQMSPRHLACQSHLQKREPPKFLGWEKVLHPSQPVAATGEIPQPTRAPRPKVRTSQMSQLIPIKPPTSPLMTPTLPNPSPPAQAWHSCGCQLCCMAFQG